MPSDLTAALIPSRTDNREARLTVEVSEDDLLGLHVLGAVAGVGEPDSDSFAGLLKTTFHRGLVESYKAAGFAWPPEETGTAAEPGAGAVDDTSPRQAASIAPRAEKTHARRVRTQTVRGMALAAAAAATVVLIIGSYAGHWTWTGLTQNGQVWDWMELLLLPVAIGALPIWLRFEPQMSPARRKALGGAVVLFAAFVLAGYVVPLKWTGFRGHTLWSWLTLLVLPTTVAAATVWAKIPRTLRPDCRAAAAALVVAWMVTLIGGYAGGWGWTGYPGNTLWDWVQLLLAPLAITTFVVPELIRVVAGPVADEADRQAPDTAPTPASA